MTTNRPKVNRSARIIEQIKELSFVEQVLPLTYVIKDSNLLFYFFPLDENQKIKFFENTTGFRPGSNEDWTHFIFWYTQIT